MRLPMAGLAALALTACSEPYKRQPVEVGRMSSPTLAETNAVGQGALRSDHQLMFRVFEFVCLQNNWNMLDRHEALKSIGFQPTAADGTVWFDPNSETSVTLMKPIGDFIPASCSFVFGTADAGRLKVMFDSQLVNEWGASSIIPGTHPDLFALLSAHWSARTDRGPIAISYHPPAINHRGYEPPVVSASVN